MQTFIRKTAGINNDSPLYGQHKCGLYRKIGRLVTLCCLCFAFPAHAAVTCNVNNTSLVFGVYNPFNAAATTSNGTVSMTCSGSSTANYTIKLNKGLWGSLSTRQMANGSYRLNYNLYTASSFGTIWGDGTSGTGTVTGTCRNATCTKTAYGRIPASQISAGVGAYTDNVTITVTY